MPSSLAAVSSVCVNGEPNAIANTVDYPMFYSRSSHAVIRVYDEAGNLIETHEAGRASSASP